ncbi:2-oxoglutarate (2OG) and Fe(II)-dependent oxygenase superfamily protein [Carex rostrata]
MASSSATLCHSHGGTAAIPFTLTDEEQIPSPPPPTPCNNSLSTGDTDAFLSHLLTRLSLPPPTLTPVLPLRSKRKPITPPVVSLREPNREPFLLAATELGLFHVCDHDIPSHLHETYLQNYRSNRVVSDTTDLGYRGSNDEGHIDMFETDSDDEFAREMERVGLKVLELLFEEKGLDLGTETRCLMCVSINKMEMSLMEKVSKEHLGSCVVQLTYEGRGKKVPSEVVDDSGKWVPVEAREGAVLVTIGEVAQVWSNGRFKKLRSLPQPSPSSLHQSKDPGNVLVTLLITLPVPAEGTLTLPMPTIVQDTNISS